MIMCIIVSVAAVLLDFATKRIVMANMSLFESGEFIPGFLEFYYIRNDGAAWGMLDGSRWIFIVLSLAAIAVLPIVIYKYGKKHTLVGLSLSLMLGGAIGNMIDRTFYGEKLFGGSVVDFLHFQMKKFPILNEGFPVFNVADLCVTFGAFIMIIYLIFFDGSIFDFGKKEKTEASENDKN